MKFIDLTGEIFNNIQIKSFCEKRGRRSFYNAICICGNSFIVEGQSIKTGNAKSCGCLHIKQLIERSTTHLKCETPAYYTWANMIQRCTNHNLSQYKDYGGRGIKVCDRWLHSFENFFEDMGNRPDGMTLDRDCNDHNYCKDNCHWATYTEQQNNKRNNHIVTYKNESLTVAQWAKKTGIKYNTLIGRLNIYKWTIERSLTTGILN